MKHISISGLDVSRIGLGCMSMSGYYNIGAGSDAESIRTIHRALDLGVTHIDTAEIYGPFTNEELVGRALKGRRGQVVLATKFGIVSHPGGGPGVLDSSPANIRAAVSQCQQEYTQVRDWVIRDNRYLAEVAQAQKNKKPTTGIAKPGPAPVVGPFCQPSEVFGIPASDLSPTPAGRS